MSCDFQTCGAAAPGASGSSRPPLLALPYNEACEDRIRDFWVSFDEVGDRFPALCGPGISWQPALWQSRGITPHRSLTFTPCNPDVPNVSIVIELCVDRGAAVFYPCFSVREATGIRSSTAEGHLDMVVTDLRRLAQAAVVAFRRFRTYAVVGGSCHDFVLEVGQEMGLTPLQALQPQADRLTEELEDLTRPTAVRIAGFVAARVAATLVGSAPVIAATDGMVTLGAACQLSRLAYVGLHDRFVPAAVPRSHELASSSASGTQPGEVTGKYDWDGFSTSTQWRARRYHVASENTAKKDCGTWDLCL